MKKLTDSQRMLITEIMQLGLSKNADPEAITRLCGRLFSTLPPEDRTKVERVISQRNALAILELIRELGYVA